MRNMKDLVHPKGQRKKRALLLLSIGIFTAVYQWVYVSWVNPTFGYLGFAYVSPPITYFILACVLSISPGLWMPIGLTRPSQLLYWVLYLTVFIPSMFVPLYIKLMPLSDIAFLMVSLFAGFAIIGMSYFRPLLIIRPFPISGVVFWYVIGSLILALTGLVIIVYWGHFRLVALESVYEELRSSGLALSEGTLVGYAILWLSGAFFPFLMAWGLYKRRRLFFVAGASGQLLLYTTAGMKGVLLSIAFIPILFITLRGKAAFFGLKLTVGCILLFLLLNGANIIGGDDYKESLHMPSSTIFLRTFSFPGMLAGQYHRFFADHPLTYYSHVKGVNLLLEYPYERDLGQEVAFHYYFRYDLNWNANFWCTDGLAALGLPGILLISIICGFVFWVLDSVADGHDPPFIALVTGFAALNISNSSLFTSLYSGGLGFLIMIFYFMPRESKQIKPHGPRANLARVLVNKPLLSHVLKVADGPDRELKVHTSE